MGRMVGLAVAAALFSIPVHAQDSGWHFGSWKDGPAAAFTRYPNDPCQREEMRSNGMLSYLNAKAGRVGGPSARVVAIEALQGAAGQMANFVSCRGQVRLEGGQQETGTLTIQDPGGAATLNVNWETDTAKAQRLSLPKASISPPPKPTSEAGDARCNAPPYSGTVAGYKAFVKNFGAMLDDPTRTLSSVCASKFGGDRKALYNLGFTDADIDSKNTSDLSVDVVTALWELAQKIK